ncbi:alpha-1,6-mannosyltransferase subunit (Ecm39), putative [Cordyceps militaris CM01]|uniref:Mannosyltransferase n=1 Tax=Cordyceps militaris (strain CM01) TaxID=983644 RepID=G3JLD3_CORMM|nr:alpha-1,6-mannosyltransferase subunit (Ecm39), putative [Cordyceps militaris CM01]EGX90507.1 alpha-1,6-mannosyltransferase subunit (Ecm39), putative [Cordyceps militaris CM01]
MAPNPFDLALNALLFAVPLAHLLVAPHTKVEESFNLQAAHDILVYGTPTAGAALTSTYDHFAFPGAVPRTFTGAVVLAAASQPLIALLGFAAVQGVVRAVLAAANAACLLVFRRALDAAFGRATGRWWVALMLGQFHVMFYLGRTLPNMFSFGLTTLASAFLLPKATPALANARQKQALLFLVLSAAVFRAETALLLCSTCLMLLVRGRATLAQLIPLLAALSLGALALTVPIDSYFWQRVPLWPELAGFYYNAVLGASSDWGTSPWHYYFSAAMLLLSSLNYPGGDAVAELFRLAPASATTLGETVAVHADVLTCMTGLTLFGQNPHGLPLAHGAPSPLPPGVARPLLLFDKTEDEAALARADFWTRFDYVLVEDPGKVAGGQWRTIGVVQGYDGVEVLRPGATAGGDDDSDDVEANPQVASLRPPVLGRGLVVRNLRNLVRSITGGWYAGPRMAPRIHIMQQITAQSSPGKAAVE